MTSFRTCNGRIAVEPFPKLGMEVKNTNGFAIGTQKNDLIPLRVVFPTVNVDAFRSETVPYFEGDTVYVTADATKHQWAKEVHDHGGQRFILLPDSFVVMVDRIGHRRQAS